MLLVIQIFLSGINNPSMIVLYTHVTSVTMLLAIKAILSSIKIQLEGLQTHVTSVTMLVAIKVFLRSTYPCDQCEYYAKKIQLFKETQRIYTCEHFDFVARHRSHLKLHIKSKHKGVSYSCEKCDYVTTFAAQLRSYKESVPCETAPI